MNTFFDLYWAINPHTIREFVSDSFTLIVGFVAIGIPLGMQVLTRAAEKYKSEHLIDYLSRWHIVSPTRLFILSIIYIIFAFIFKYNVADNHEPLHVCPVYMYGIAWALVAYFLILFSAVGFWYGHLFSQAKKRPKDIFNDLSK